MEKEKIKAIEHELFSYNLYLAKIKNMELDLKLKDYNTLRAVNTSEENFNASFSIESLIERKIVKLEKEEEKLKGKIKYLKNKVKKIENCIESFTEEEKEIFNARYIEEKTYKEICILNHMSIKKLLRIRRDIVNKCLELFSH